MSAERRTAETAFSVVMPDSKVEPITLVAVMVFAASDQTLHAHSAC